MNYASDVLLKAFDTSICFKYVTLIRTLENQKLFILGPVSYVSVELYKAIIVGPPNVGKSSLVRRYQNDEFKEAHTATIAAELSAATFEFPEGRVVLTIVDVGGQESFVGLRHQFYQGAHHLIMVYDVTSRSTFDRIPDMYHALTDKICIQSEKFLGGSLVANKFDMQDQAQVSSRDGQLLADLLTLRFFETSAKTGRNVSELFHHAAAESRRWQHSR
jgi:small GTP-binding protein